MDIDGKRIAAVRALEALGYAYRSGEWLAPASDAAAPLSFLAKADNMHGALMRRADALAGCTEGSDEEAELNAIVDAIEPGTASKLVTMSAVAREPTVCA